MLQQTQVATVISFYKRFIKQFPTVKKLAAADQADVLRAWEGLGYYRRARQMHAAAQVIVEEHNGKFPFEFDDVLALPGIGRYTAGAILSISREEKLPILEGNTIRLFARLMAMEEDPRTSANQKLQWAFSESLLPNKRIGDFNQALMEVGSLICTVKNPSCDDCPLQSICPTYVRGLQDKIPVAARKMQYEEINEAVLVVPRSGKYLVRKCGEDERWAGLWDFPRFQMVEDQHAGHLQSELKNLSGLETELEDTEQKIKHAVTRFKITLDCFIATSVKGRLKKAKTPIQWVTMDEIESLPMSVTGRKIARRLGKLKPAQKRLF